MSRVAIIPAKSGSRRLPGKNFLPFWGRPIIEYSIETARASKLFDYIVVSTDDEAVAERYNGAGVLARMRPTSAENFGTQELAAFVLRQGTLPDYACVIYATAPMLTAGDLEAGWRALARGAAYAMAVGAKPLRDAGCFYFGRTWAFLDGSPLIGPDTAMIPIPEERVCDVNTQEDFDRAVAMYAALHPAATKRRLACVASS